VACLQGPAGCGKTKIALQYLTALGQNKRVFVFVPRTAIGESLFHELVDNYGISAGVEFLSGTKKLFSRRTPSGFEKIETPEHLQGTGNLVITTIDQLCKTMLSHQKIDLITQLADSHVIFDEFHELVELPGIVLLFLEVMRLRQFSGTGTLLVSATPNPQLLAQLKVTPRAVVKVASFNTKPLAIHLTPWNAQVYAGGDKAEPHPFYAGGMALENGAFVICNTATVAQQASVAYRISGRNAICFHSKFTPKDKSALLGRILQLFGSQSVVSDEVLIAGPIVQASLNISTRTMHTEMCHGENALQRIGRVNRFGTVDAAAIHFYYALGAPEPKTGAASLANSAALSSMHQRHRTNAFYRFLARKHAVELHADQCCVLSLGQLYAWYDEFHGSPETKAAYELDFQSILRASVKVFADNDFDPVQYPSFAKAKTGAVKLARNSLRGRSYYILPLALRLASAGSKGDLALLWDQMSDTNHLLTDELRASGFDENVRNKYFTWSKGATKPGVLSPLITGSGVDLLKAMTKTTKSFKAWPQLRGKAVVRESPILVCRQKYDDDNLYYFEYAALKVGLIKAAHLAKIPALRIKAAL
jgi:CRISPR-associated endonuclease/helicase Cas3